MCEDSLSLSLSLTHLFKNSRERNSTTQNFKKSGDGLQDNCCCPLHRSLSLDSSIAHTNTQKKMSLWERDHVKNEKTTQFYAAAAAALTHSRHTQTEHHIIKMTSKSVSLLTNPKILLIGFLCGFLRERGRERE